MSRLLWRMGAVLLLAAVGWSDEGNLCAAESADAAARLRLVPFPKKVILAEGSLALKQAWRLELPAEMDALAQQIADEMVRAGFDRPRLMSGQTVGGAGQRQDGLWMFRLVPDGGHQGGESGKKTPLLQSPVFRPEATEEDYSLQVTPEQIIAWAKGPAGLFYAGQTLCQLLRANRLPEDRLPCLVIEDWPSLRWRCFQDDLTRGPSTKLASLQRSIQLGAYLKHNLWTYYMEYQYAFRKHPEIGPPDGSLEPEELKALVEFAKKYHTEVLGNQQSFGHFGWILRHEKYAHLRETSDVLTPVREETYQLLDDLYSEVCPLLPFEWFNVCCDETWGLGKGPSKQLAEKIGVGGVYVQHIRRIHGILRDKYKKRMMMWGDIILQHPDQLEQIPKDVIMLTWGYGPAESFEHQIIPFKKAGYEFFVCPGISNWSRILPDFDVAMKNIQNFVRDGVKHGALGMLNTDWEDDGEALQGYRWHGHAWGAECAWNGSATRPEDFQRRIGAVLFGEPGDRFGQAITLLAQTHRLPGMDGMENRRFWQNDFPPARSATAIRKSADRLLSLVRPAIEHLETCRKQATVNADLLDSFLHGARRMELIGQRMLDGLEAAQLYQKAYTAPASSVQERIALLEKVEHLVRRNRDAHQALGEEFSRLWLADCKPYALDWTMRRYQQMVGWYEELLKRLAEAKRAAQKAEALPSPEAIGLLRPPTDSRRTRPHRVESQPMEPQSAWLVPEATHRLGLQISAGPLDRWELPVQVDLWLPAELANGMVRAFALVGSAKPGSSGSASSGGGLGSDVVSLGGSASAVAAGPSLREIPAQLDPSPDSAGQVRLSFLLPGPIPKGDSARVWVYLGLPRSRTGSAKPGTEKVEKSGSRWAPVEGPLTRPAG
ncbi:MAG: beta-N-acetylhexosaminidase, partial [Thermoguttaceae bacterium]|nr:beta-N-acetylhexosaminidase [Thermoguttaceae bacterium]